MFTLRQGESLSLQIANPNTEGIRQPWNLYQRIVVALSINNTIVKFFEYPNAEGKPTMQISDDGLLLSFALLPSETMILKGHLAAEIALINQDGDDVVIPQAVICSIVPSLIKELL